MKFSRVIIISQILEDCQSRDCSDSIRISTGGINEFDKQIESKIRGILPSWIFPWTIAEPLPSSTACVIGSLSGSETSSASSMAIPTFTS